MSGKHRKTPREVSVHARLLAMAKQRDEQLQMVLTVFGYERFLHRLGRSPHAKRFVLKGAMLFGLWLGPLHRPTRDLDLLGHGAMDPETGLQIFRDICCQPVDDDALRFDLKTLTVQRIREEEVYSGLRFKLDCFLGVARIPLQIDVGTGDAVTPEPVDAEFPTLLDDLPRLRTYPRETVVAEKFQAMVMLGVANTRVKDFYDLWTLARRFAFDGLTLSAAIAATFERRSTAIPDQRPMSLHADFWAGGAKWRTFLTRNRLPDESPIDDVLRLLVAFLLPPARALRSGASFASQWAPGGPWA